MSDPGTPGPHPSQTVLIVGAGPVGMVAACALARQGVLPRLVDALPVPTDQSRAIVVQPRTQDLLAGVGVLERMIAVANPQRYLEIEDPSQRTSGGPRTLVRIDLSGLPTRYPSVLNLPQTETEAALRERVGELGISIERGVKLTGLVQDAAGVSVTLSSDAGDEKARFAWVIGTDGGHSAVRTLAGSKLEGSFKGSHFAMADVHVVTDLPRDVTRLFAGDGLSVMFPMLDGRTRLMFQIPDPKAAPGDGPSLEQVQEWVDERMGELLRVTDPRWLTYYSIHHAQVPKYRIGRVLIAGDAAHIHSPAAGQGMNTGMQDAANLAWKLALVCRGLADDKILDSYHAERHPIGAQVVRQTTLMAKAMTLHEPAVKIRNAVLSLAGRVEPMTTAVAQHFAELTVAYPDSPIVAYAGRAGRFAGTVHAGVHAPDVPGLIAADGTPRWIGDLLRSPGHLLLARTTDPTLLEHLRGVLGELGTVVPVAAASASNPLDGALLDPGGAFEASYGIGEGGLVLIRPDGYVGYVARTHATAEELQAYLAQVLHIRTGELL